MNQQIANRLNSVAVSTYKVMGSVLLGLILVGLMSFLAVQGFFLASSGWVTPTILSPTDPNVLQLNAQAAQQESERDALMAKRRETADRLQEAERTAATERSFQQRFLVALRGEKISRERLSRRLSALRQEYLRAGGEIAESNRAYSGLARTRTSALFGAKLLEREDVLTVNHHLAQMAQSNLSLAQETVDLDMRLDTLRRERQGLTAAENGLGQDDAPEGLTTDTLLLEREYTQSVLALARAEAQRKSLEEDVRALDDRIRRFNQLLLVLHGSPYLKALEQNLTVAFVPYENLTNARAGTPLYTCALKLLWCREVGVVGPVLEGEVSQQHPIRQYHLRGVMVELQLRDAPSAREPLLHLGHPPLML
ncbi:MULTISPECIES: hypothetical protein [Corallococcus]|uniref:hypothetical protein n=1 Tax=Corallococcus TaxID=83461 RepID=UPI00118115C4|nr:MULTISPECIES: hypothetical protein [Corallococcus]NBD09308.1 hypothetical protein [Corallococcus silvisoli]TSC31274.1 hypothetical protein FOF48_11335 [Corallococcus sp. Z5C101001]